MNPGEDQDEDGLRRSLVRGKRWGPLHAALGEVVVEARNTLRMVALLGAMVGDDGFWGDVRNFVTHLVLNFELRGFSRRGIGVHSPGCKKWVSIGQAIELGVKFWLTIGSLGCQFYARNPGFCKEWTCI